VKCEIISYVISYRTQSPQTNLLLSAIPKQICDPKLPLEKLDISSNNLAAIPTEICNLKALTELNLDNNVLVSLPVEIGELRKLKVLSLRDNHIQVVNANFSVSNPQPIPSSLFENTPLIDLNLHGNKLTSTQLNEFEGFSIFLERRKMVKTKNLYGGAMDGDSTNCGLK
jgi:Leucine-rich repeat (LRR) protein